MATQVGTQVDNSSAGNAAALGVAFTRIVFPLWLLLGAILKLVDGSPSHLPSILVKVLGPLGVDLMFVLRYIVAIELVVVGVVWILPRIARPVALAMLGAFFPILVGDVLLGSSSCGCFGAISVPPIVTLLTDGGLFLAILLLGRSAPSLRVPTRLSTVRTVVTGVWILVSFAAGFYLTGRVGDAEATTASDHSLAALPAEGYYVPDYAAWIENAWTDVRLSAWVQGAPGDLGTGTHYLIFYRKDCEHCHELMEVFFSGPLDIPTTAIAVPERDGFPST